MEPRLPNGRHLIPGATGRPAFRVGLPAKRGSSVLVAEEEEVRARLRAERSPGAITLAFLAVVAETNDALFQRTLLAVDAAVAALVLHLENPPGYPDSALDSTA